MQNQQQGNLPEIRQTVIFNVPIQKVWEAVSTSEGIASWWMQNTFKAEVGYEFVLHAGPYGVSECKVTELDPPLRLSFSWAKDWQITFELKELDGKTEFTLIHAGWDADKVTEFGETHGVVRERMNDGWANLVAQKLRSKVEA